jgi:hypothetical protein
MRLGAWRRAMIGMRLLPREPAGRLIAVLALVSAAYAASPEEDYFAARDKAIVQEQMLTRLGNRDKAEAIQSVVLADLEKRLLALVGPTSVTGFSSQPKINLETLGEGTDYGKLDGLAYGSSEPGSHDSRLIVTTKSLLVAWLRGHAVEIASARDPVNLDEALRSDTFYALALGDGSAFSRAAEIGIAKPADAEFAVAAIARRSSVIEPSPLDRVVVAVVKNSRVFVADVASATKIPEVPACLALWRAADAKADVIENTSQEDGDDPIPFDQIRKIRETGARDWLACAGRAIGSAPFYPRLEQQAQALVDRMAGG